jgi:hypothetical protein
MHPEEVTAKVAITLVAAQCIRKQVDKGNVHVTNPHAAVHGCSRPAHSS